MSSDDDLGAKVQEILRATDDQDDENYDEATDFPFVAGIESSTAALVAQWRAIRDQHAVGLTGVSASGAVGNLSINLPPGGVGFEGQPAVVAVQPPAVAIGMLLDVGDRTDEGQIITAVTPAWVGILERLDSDSNALSRLDWREVEEVVAGGYREYGWRVVLTPRSGDGGRDIIATRDDVGAIRILDQVKAYAPGHVVNADEVRAMFGVLSLDQKASKACITTTSRFAPGVDAGVREGDADPA
jgi:restriction system protein